MEQFILGTPYERGNSDDIVSRQYPEGGIGEGLFCSMVDDNDVALVTASTTVYGITGKVEIGACDVITGGKKIFVQTDLDDTATIDIGEPAYMDAATGKVTNDDTKSAIKAVFRSQVVKCVDSKGQEFNGVAIDFDGAL